MSLSSSGQPLSEVSEFQNYWPKAIFMGHLVVRAKFLPLPSRKEKQSPASYHDDFSGDFVSVPKFIIGTSLGETNLVSHFFLDET